MGNQGDKHIEFEDFRDNGAMYRSLYESAYDAIFLMRGDTFMDCNPQALKMFRCRKENIVGKRPYDDFSPLMQPDGSASRDKAMEMIAAVMDGTPQVFEWQHRRCDGTLFLTQVSLTPLNTREGEYFQAIVRDITAWKETEAALRAAEERYRLLFDNAPLGLYRTTPDGRILMANPAMVKMLGYASLDDLFLRSLEDDNVFQDYSREDFKEAMERDGRVAGLEATWKRLDGTVLWVRESAVAIRDDNGNIKYYDGIVEDITERKVAQERLRDSEEKYRTLVEYSNCLIYILKGNRMIYANRTTCEALGYTREELYKMDLWDLVHPDDREYLKRVTYLPQGPEGSKGKMYDGRLVRKDGSTLYCQFSGGVVMFKHGPAVMGIARDVTRIYRLEREVQKVQRLESLGLLAGGIAHDFNNLLTGIMGHISLARMMVADGDPKLDEILKEAEDASVAAKKLTGQLLTFSSGGAPIKQTMDIQEVIEESARFILRGSNVKGKFIFAKGLRMVDADREQLSQVINNLVINAVQAMPGGGELCITAENIELTGDNSLYLGPGKYVHISVKDTGIGIPTEDMDKIFDPYFSTKKNGSGIGLAVSYSIVKRHNGVMDVHSEVNKGTTFDIYLPALEQAGTAVKTTHKFVDTAEPLVYPDNKRILLMDDKAVIQRVASTMLRNLGYDVDTASDGLQAVRMYKSASKSGRGYACVILDLVVPKGMGGKEAIQKLLEFDPNAVAIVSSGYSSDPIMANYREYGFKGVIAKPYLLQDLAQVLHTVIRRHNPAGKDPNLECN